MNAAPPKGETARGPLATITTAVRDGVDRYRALRTMLRAHSHTPAGNRVAAFVERIQK